MFSFYLLTYIRPEFVIFFSCLLYNLSGSDGCHLNNKFLFYILFIRQPWTHLNSSSRPVLQQIQAGLTANPGRLTGKSIPSYSKSRPSYRQIQAVLQANPDRSYSKSRPSYRQIQTGLTANPGRLTGKSIPSYSKSRPSYRQIHTGLNTINIP